MGLLGIVLFVFALLLSIVLHEAGHMVCARRAGGKVTEFFVGFGAKLWSFRRGETEYGFKAIPAGGYVKIVGMTDLEPIAPEDEPRAFYRKPLGPRLITLAAGSIVHFLIALFLLILIPLAWGEPRQDFSGTIGHVAPCLRQTVGDCQPGDPQSPAAAAGLKDGDKIVAVGGKPVSSWTDVVTQLHAGKAGDPVQVVVTRGGQQLPPVSVTPTKGNASVDKTKYVKGMLIGVSAPDSYMQSVGPLQAVGNGFNTFGSLTKASVIGLVDIPKSIPKLFHLATSNAPPTAGQPTDVVGMRPTGVVGMAGVSGDVIKRYGYAGFLGFIASINLFIGIFNLLPLLPLDGGHIAIALYEGARRKIAQLRHQPDPGRVDLNKLMPVAFTFLVVFVGLSLLLMAADINNPFKLPG